MRRRGKVLAIVAACGLGLLAAREAQAHFLFVRIGPMAEGGRSAEVYFSDQAEAGDPKFVDRIASTRLWLQAEPGEFTELVLQKEADHLRATVPASGSLAIVGACEYGVIARPGQTPFLLRHFPKAVAGSPEKVNAFKPRSEHVLEIIPTFEADRIKLAVSRRGAPIPGALFHAVDADLTASEAKAGADGLAVWTPPAPGRYSIYVGDVVKQSGEHGGKHYDEIREFASLAFTWPLQRRGADPEAVALFEKALATRATWDDFPGFTAKAEGSVDGRAFSGKVTVGPDGAVEVAVDEPLARPWLENQVSSIAMHRFADDRDPPVVRFADDDENHPLGRLLAFEGGHFASSYRVKDGQITSVNRHIGKQNMTISVLDNVPNAERKYLPQSYLVQYWNAANGELSRVETVQERWVRVGRWDLPARHMVSTSSGAGFSVRSLTLSGHSLLKEK